MLSIFVNAFNIFTGSQGVVGFSYSFLTSSIATVVTLLDTGTISPYNAAIVLLGRFCFGILLKPFQCVREDFVVLLDPLMWLMRYSNRNKV